MAAQEPPPPAEERERVFRWNRVAEIRPLPWTPPPHAPTLPRQRTDDDARTLRPQVLAGRAAPGPVWKCWQPAPQTPGPYGRRWWFRPRPSCGDLRTGSLHTPGHPGQGWGSRHTGRPSPRTPGHRDGGRLCGRGSSCQSRGDLGLCTHSSGPGGPTDQGCGWAPEGLEWWPTPPPSTGCWGTEDGPPGVGAPECHLIDAHVSALQACHRSWGQ